MKFSRPIRALQIIDSLGMGGAETWLMELLRLWSRTRVCEIDFLATSGKPGIFDEEVRHHGAQIHYIRYGRAHLPRFAAEFRRLLREGRYDAIHDHQDYASGWHYLMGGKLLPPTRVTHVHNPWLHIEANYGVGPVRKATAMFGKHLVKRFATHICGTSEEILCRYGFDSVQASMAIVSALHCGFEIGKFNKTREFDRDSVLREFSWPDNSRLVLFVGRLDRALKSDHPQTHKNSWFALNVVRTAFERQSSVRLLMAGAGESQRQDMERRIKEWGLADKLRLIGIRSDVDRLMRSADALLFPSRQEGLGMVAVEAQAAGLPVLASTAVPSECIVIPDLYHALPLRESLEKWADKLIAIMSKPRLPLEQCRRALESSAFSIENSARRLEDIYGSASR